jgi:hypothetical protein
LWNIGLPLIRNGQKTNETKTFENQGEGYSSYVAINSDSSFEFLVVGEGPDHLAVGKWKRLSNSIISLPGIQLRVSRHARITRNH